MVLPAPNPAMMMPPPGPPMAAPMGSPLALMGQPAPSPLMGGMGMMDPMAMLADPQVLIALLDLIERERELQNGPVYKKWYKPGDYPKPKPADIEAKARADRSLYQQLIRRFGEDRAFMLLLTVGRFADFDEDAETTFQDNSLAQDVALVENLVGGTTWNFEANARRSDEAEIAEKKEQFAHALMEKTERRHSRMYGTAFRFDEVKYAVEYGHVVYRHSLDFDAESDEVPVNIDLLDPATCFPTWDGDRGLKTMTRIYPQTVDQVIATWSTYENAKKLRTKLLDKKVKNSDGTERYRTLDDRVEVIEYWDRRWYCITVESDHVISTEHKYGFVPFVYKRSRFGDAGPSSLDSLNTYGFGRHRAQEEIAAKGLSHIWASKTNLSQREAVIGRMFTEFKKTGNPPRTFAVSGNYAGDTPQVSDMEGARSTIPMGEVEEVPGPQKPGLSLAPAILGVINEGIQRSLQPPGSYGLTQNANESGTAIEGLNEAGRDKLTAWLVMLEDSGRDNAEMGLTLQRDWGHLLGTDGQKGELYLDRVRPKPGEDETFTLTSEELRQVGVKIRCKRTSLRLANLAGLGNALTAWKNNGWLEDVEAMEMKGTRDPIAALKRIQIQEILKQPEVMKVQAIKYFEEQGLHDEATMLRQLAMQQDMGAQAGPPGGTPPGPPGGPGVNGGAPPGMPMGPQGANPNMGAMGTQSRLPGPPPMLEGPPPGGPV